MPKSTPKKLKYQRAYNARPAEKKKRAKNNAARRQALREGRVKKGDGKDVAHVKSLKAGGSNARSNLKVQSRSTNRGWRKGQSGYNPDA